MTQLYVIKNDYLNALKELYAMPDLDNQIIEDSLAPIKDELQEKALNIAAYIKDLETDAVMMQKYEENMRNRRKSIERTIERLRDYLKFNLQASKIKTIKGTEFDISIRKTIPKLIIDETKLGKEWYHEKVIQNVDKEALRVALEAGSDIEGALLQEQVSLIIK